MKGITQEAGPGLPTRRIEQQTENSIGSGTGVDPR